MKTALKGLLAGASTLVFAGALSAQQLTFAGGWPPGSSPTKMLEDYAKAIEEYTNGDVTMRVFPLSQYAVGILRAGRA